MNRRSATPAKRPGRLKRLTERVILGALMTVAVVIAERRLHRALKGERDAGSST